MKNEYQLYHPYRFAIVAARLIARTASLKSTALSNADEIEEYSGLTDADFSARLETYNQVGWIRDHWAKSGRKIIDASRAPPPTREIRGAFPEFPEGKALYVHLGDMRTHKLSPLTKVEGVYVMSGEQDGVRGCHFAIVGAVDPSEITETIGGLLVIQSMAAIGFAPRGDWTKATASGDPAVCDNEVVAWSLAETSALVSDHPGPAGERETVAAQPSPSKPIRH